MARYSRRQRMKLSDLVILCPPAVFQTWDPDPATVKTQLITKSDRPVATADDWCQHNIALP